jgi:hypothetical protein
MKCFLRVTSACTADILATADILSFVPYLDWSFALKEVTISFASRSRQSPPKSQKQSGSSVYYSFDGDGIESANPVGDEDKDVQMKSVDHRFVIQSYPSALDIG